MIGQTRARLPAVAGAVILLLTGITAWIVKPGAEQAIEITEANNVTLDTSPYDTLDKAFHSEARQARLDTKDMVTEELSQTLQSQPTVLIARAAPRTRERG